MRTAGLDVHKDSIFGAVFDGKRYSEAEVFETFGTGISDGKHEYLQGSGVEYPLGDGF